MNKRPSRQDAQGLLRRCLDHGIVESHPHCLRALKDDGLDLIDALPILRTGIIYDEPEFDVRFQHWRYKVEGNAPNGAWMVIVFTFRTNDEILLITAYFKERPRR
ncbi:MAG TPA: DUF4258 domain-containing protein [Verrucomicrobiae bacterium]|nr:DUF4258 domain-containing protein [Verrucomicrobiae bacterium]